ncbi:MAG: hypothetical protein WCR71_05130 [Bacteroidales bacterium]
MNQMVCKFICAFLTLATFSSLYSQEPKGGSVFYEQTRELSFTEREEMSINEIISGNMPDFIKNYVAITFFEKDAKGEQHQVTIYVSPDYLSVGSSLDYYIIPLSPMASTKIAKAFNSSLPTPKLVDLIYEKATLKLEPFNYIPRGNRNETPDLLYEHSKVIQAQIKAAGYSPGVFVAGTKKDLVISSKLADSTRQHHVTIYGWHKLNGKPIQPLSNVHINSYVDYSHGTRLICNRVLVDGKAYNYNDILKNSLLYTLLSNESEPLRKTRY